MNRFLIASALLLLGTARSEAGTAGGQLHVSTTILDSCSVYDATLTFSPYQGVELEGGGGITLQCTGKGANVNIQVGAGEHDKGAGHNMQGEAGDQLGYSLFQDYGRTMPWDASTVQSVKIGGELTVVPIYGVIAGGQSGAPGAYTDNVTVTLTF